MTPRPTPRVALWLLERFVADSEPLAGDLAEEHARGRSRAWVWRQVIGAFAAAAMRPAGDIRPIRLLDAQPLEAVSRTLAFRRRERVLNLNANPTAQFGGLSVVVLGGILTATAPYFWALLAAAVLAGACFGVALIATERHAQPPTSVRAR
ncbi:MAG: hypothetical protein AB1635_15855 [Acidobacteriota bacterium]